MGRRLRSIRRRMMFEAKLRQRTRARGWLSQDRESLPSSVQTFLKLLSVPFVGDVVRWRIMRTPFVTQ